MRELVVCLSAANGLFMPFCFVFSRFANNKPLDYPTDRRRQKRLAKLSKT